MPKVVFDQQTSLGSGTCACQFDGLRNVNISQAAVDVEPPPSVGNYCKVVSRWRENDGINYVPTVPATLRLNKQIHDGHKHCDKQHLCQRHVTTCNQAVAHTTPFSAVSTHLDTGTLTRGRSEDRDAQEDAPTGPPPPRLQAHRANSWSK